MAKLLPKETETKSSGSDDTSTSSTTAAATDIATEVSTVVNSCDLEENQQNSIVQIEDSPKFDQYLLESIAAAVTSSTSITSSMGFPNYSSAGNSQSTNNDPHEMPQLLNILNELLDGQDITSLANSGGNGDNMQDIDEENYEDDSPRKDDPDEISKMLAQQKLEEINRKEQQIQRKMDFLIRRLYKLVARSTGLHVSEEVAGFLEHVARFTRKKEKERQLQSSVSSKFPYLTANLQGTTSELLKSPPVTLEPPLNLLSSPSTSQENSQQNPLLSTEIAAAVEQTAPTNVIEPPVKEDPPKPVPIHEMKSFLRRIDNISSLQSTALNKRGLAFKYFTKSSSNNLNQTSSLSSSSKTHHNESSSSSNSNNFKVSAIPKFSDLDVDQVEQTSGRLMTEMRLIENQIDSDATASSTGGESADEMIPYNNQYQQPLSISKRAAYKYAKDRGAVASRWCWLSTQISELDYKIRQLNDLKKHIRENKGIVSLEAAGFEGQLPGNSTTRTYNRVDSDTEEDDGMTSARTRPFVNMTFRKRKLVQIANLHQISKKAARPSTLKCGCNWPIQPCALCTGRVDPTQPRECNDVLPESERVALLDSSFHPVLSFPEDVSSTIHLEAICNIPEWQSKMIRSSPKSIMKHATKQLESLEGNNGRYKDEHKQFGIARTQVYEGEKKLKKSNIDISTGKRKYTKRLLKLDPSSLASKIKDRKKYKKKNVSLALSHPHIPTRKYTFKKRIPKVDELINYNSKINGLNGTDKSYDIHRSKNSSPVPNKSEIRRTRNYDIDNIVIPYSVKTATRIEVLSYKEIPTPKWRIIDDEEEEQQLMLEEDQCEASGEVIDENITDECMATIHDKAMLDERKKFETYLKFPLTSRSRANRRIDSRGNESSGANTPTPDATSPAHPIHGDLESIPSPMPLLDGHPLNETPSITALLNNLNGKKERKRTTSKKDEVHDGGGSKSGSASRCISPDIKEIIPAYEPLSFPLTEVSFHQMKKEMPEQKSRRQTQQQSQPQQQQQQQQNNASLTNSTPSADNFFVSLETSHPQKQITVKRTVVRPTIKKRKHNDSISESILIKEKLPSSALSTVGKNNNVLIPRNKNNHNLLNSIDLKSADSVALKKLMNNNNGDLINGAGDGTNSVDLEHDEEEEDNEMDDNSDSETVTGDESLEDPEEDDDDQDLFEPDEEEEEEEEDTESDEEEYLEEYEDKVYNNKKKNNSTSIVDCHY